MGAGEVLEAFSTWQLARGMSPRTVRSRRSTLGRFLRWAGDGWCGLDWRAVEAWVDGQADWSAATRRRCCGDLSTLWRWAVRSELCDHSPMGLVERPQVAPYVPHPAPPAEVAVLMFSTSRRVRLTSALGAYAGLRIAEVAALDWPHVDLSAQQLTVEHGKGGRSRTLPIAPALAGELSAVEVEAGPVVASRYGGHLQAASLGRWLAAAYRAHGLGGFKFHSLRHYFATRLLSETGNLRLVQEALGHADPATTAVYAQLDPAALRAIVERW